MNNPIIYVDPSGLDCYVFYDAGAEDGYVSKASAEAIAKGLEKQYKTKVHLIPMTSADDLKNGWNGMGTDYFDIKTSTIEAVVLYGHGSENRMRIYTDPGGDDSKYVRVNADFVNGLDKKEMEFLMLLGCDMGSGNDSTNFAAKMVAGKHIYTGGVIAAAGSTRVKSNGQIKADGQGFKLYKWNYGTSSADITYLNGTKYQKMSALFKTARNGGSVNPPGTPSSRKKKV